ncbi:MAG: SBBP repeat-containing protein [Cryomorphaceae bacterium]|nr:SBBP repeat-containing protein [Flavobacteriales bacterium]
MSINLFGQPGATQWVHPIQSLQESTGDGVDVDSEGNVYSIGTFSGSVDFDPSSGITVLNGASEDVYLQKFSPAGELLWARRIGGFGTNHGNTLAIDNDGYVYVAGGFEGTLTCFANSNQLSQTAEAYLDIFVAKYDSDGNVIWLKQFGGNGYDQAIAIAVDNVGGIYLTGRFMNTCNFDFEGSPQNRTAVGFHDAFILKLSADGLYQWVKQMGGLTYETGYDIHVDENGVYTTGLFDYEIRLNGTQPVGTNGDRDIFITKHSHDGQFLWGKSIGGNSNDDGRTVSTDSEGNVYVGGDIIGMVDMDPGQGSELFDGSSDYIPFILKLDEDGNYLSYAAFDYVSEIGNTDPQLAYITNICHDQSDNLYATGTFLGTIDFDPDASDTHLLTAQAGRDGFVLKLNPQNNFEWVVQYTGIDASCVPTSIAHAPEDIIYHTGRFDATIDFDPSEGSHVLESAFDGSGYLLKMFDCNSTQDTIEIEECTSFTSESGSQYTESGTFTESFNSVNGCDSVVIYEIDILGNEDHVYVSACDSYYWEESDIEYDASGEYTLQYENQHGCDSTFTLHLSVYESDDSLIEATECSGFVLPGTNEVVEQTGFYTDVFANQAGCDSLIHYDLEILNVDYELRNDDPILSVSAAESTYQWYTCNPLESIAGETLSEYTPASNGSYAVEIQQNGCTSLSDCILVEAAELSLQEAVNLYPTPTYQNNFQIDLGKPYDEVQIEIYDAHGKLVVPQKIYSGREIQIFVPKLARGLYTLRILTNDSSTAIARFVLG